MRFLMFMVALCVVASGFANDGRVIGVGGRVRFLKDENTTVRMVREDVRMDVYPSYYEVDATFLFSNDGPATTVTMGFPESGGGDIDAPHYQKASGFLRFATWVDGKQVPAQRKASADKGTGNYRAFWVKRVRFVKGQQHTVRVQYRSPPSGDTSATNGAAYMFTGGNWRGKVDESVLRIVVHLPGTTLVAVDNKNMTRKGNEFVMRRQNWQAEGSGGIGYKRTMAGYMFLDGFRYPSEIGPPDPKWEEITQPGIAEALDWAPPAVFRKGVVFLRADVLCELLQPGTKLATALSWYPATKEAVVSVRGHSFGFRRGRKTMIFDQTTEVPLPASPLLSSPVEGDSGGKLYVPVKPVLDVFDGSYTLSEKNHRLHIDLTPVKTGSAS